MSDSAAATRFTLVVHNNGEAARLAQRFVTATLAGPNRIEQVFFYHDGVAAADSNRAPAQDDPALPVPWQDLANEGGFALNVCIAAGARRGLLSDAEAQRHNKPAGNLDTDFELVGLGVFVEGLLNADRVVTFSG